VFHTERALAAWDWLAVAITLGAGVALVRYKVGTVKVLLCCAAAALVVSYSTKLI
jgi:chromate transporter